MVPDISSACTVSCRALTRTATVFCAWLIVYDGYFRMWWRIFVYTTILRIRPSSPGIFLAITKICPWTRTYVV